ncbi:hypothetical protein [Sphingomonas antarctica]|uniref:hypothetical protein n=1 Tax=Sphingomonas antarctica TaxID=2040274 RepID=UPI0039E9A65F
MSTDRAFPARPDEEATRRSSMALQGMALNALFPPPPRVPDDMLAALARIDRRPR